MNMFNKLPYSIKLKDRVYKINTDFRFIILFETKMQGIEMLSEREQNEIILEALINFCPAFFNSNNTDIDINELSKAFLWFYSGGRENYHRFSGGGSSSKKSYSYQYDDEYIYGAFYGQYGIDLTTQKIHWWKFKSLLVSLKEDTKFEQIKTYRSYSGKDENLLRVKKYWELPLSENEQKIEDEIVKQLQNYKKEGD